MLNEKVINYRELLGRATEGFVPRAWIHDTVDEFLAAESPRNLLLLGEPGSGKTSLMADLVKQRAYPHHFIGSGNRFDIGGSADWRDPVRFAESLGYQLLRDYGGWIMQWERWGIAIDQRVQHLEGRLIGAHIESLSATPALPDQPHMTLRQEAESFGAAAEVIGIYIEEFHADVEQIVQQLLIAPLRAIASRWPQRMVVIAVDGLDEADRYSNAESSILQMLPGAAVPDNVRFILSSRPGEHLGAELVSQSRIIWLSEDAEGRQDPRLLTDAERFIDEVTTEAQVRIMLSTRGIDASTFSKRVAAASRGNFLYLYFYAQGLREGADYLLEMSKPPMGLQGIYREFVRGIRKRKDSALSWQREMKPVLGTLAVTQDWITQRQAAEFSDIDQEVVASILIELKQFLDSAQKNSVNIYKIYHSSFSEYLVGDANEDYIDATKAHARIADCLLESYRKDLRAFTADDYALNHIALHLTEAGKYQELVALIDKPWLEARIEAEAGRFAGFLRDVDLAIINVKDPVQLVRLHTARRVAIRGAQAYRDQDLAILVYLGRSEEALSHALLRDAPKQQIHSLAIVAATLSDLGRSNSSIIEQARQIAESMHDEDELADANAQLAELTMRSGQLDDAVAILDSLPDEQLRRVVKAVPSLAFILARDRRLDVVDELIRVGTEEGSRQFLLAARVTALVELGRLEEAERQLANIDDAQARGTSAATLINALLNQGQYAEALALAREHGDTFNRPFLLLSVWDRDHSFGIANSLWTKLHAWLGAKPADLLDEILVGIKAIDDDGRRLLTQAGLVDHLSRKQHARAEPLAAELCREVTSLEPGKRAMVLGFVGQPLVKFGFVDDVLAQIAEISQVSQRVSVLLDVAVELAATNEAEARKLFEQARHLIRTEVTDFSERTTASAKLGLTLARTGSAFHKEASAVFTEYLGLEQTEYERRTLMYSLAHFAMVLAREGHFEGAMELTVEIEEGEQREAATKEIIKAASMQGRVDQIDEALAMLSPRDRAAYSDARIAALIVAGKTGEARDLVEAAVGASDWSRLVRGEAVGFARIGSVEEALTAARSLSKLDGYAAAATLLDVVIEIGRTYAGGHDRIAEICREALKYLAALADDDDEFDPFRSNRREQEHLFARLNAYAGELDEAWRIVRGMDRDIVSFISNRIPQHLEAQYDVIDIAARTGSLLKAADWAKAISDDEAANQGSVMEIRALALATVAVELSARDNIVDADRLFDTAIEIVRDLEDPTFLSMRRHRTTAGAGLVAKLAGAGKFTTALETLDELATTRTLDEYLQVLSLWALNLEKSDSLAMLASAAETASWVRPDWQRVSQLLR